LGAEDVSIRQFFCKCSEVFVSIVDSRPQEVLCVYFKGLEVASVRQQHSASDMDYTVLCEVKYCQVDNCLINARYPVIVWPQSLPRTFFRVVVSGRRSGPLLILSEARLNVQPVDLYVEEEVVILVLRWLRDCRKAWTATIGNVASDTLPSKLLIDMLRVEPIRLAVSMQCLVTSSPDAAFGFPEWKGPGNAQQDKPFDWRPLQGGLGWFDDFLTGVFFSPLPSLFSPMSASS